MSNSSMQAYENLALLTFFNSHAYVIAFLCHSFISSNKINWNAWQLMNLDSA